MSVVTFQVGVTHYGEELIWGYINIPEGCEIRFEIRRLASAAENIIRQKFHDGRHIIARSSRDREDLPLQH